MGQKGASDEFNPSPRRHPQRRFTLTSDGTRPANGTSPARSSGGWEIYHLKEPPVDPNRIYASQSSGWFGQLIQRSNDGGKNLAAGGQQVHL